MSTIDKNDVPSPGQDGRAHPQRSLKQAVDAAKSRTADHQDVVVDLKEAETVRLELLGTELQPVFAAIDETDDRFDIGLMRGDRPRLWVDMTTFVAMGHDKRTYRFIKDTRMGRIVLAETVNMEKMADIVSDYVAEKVLERERMIEGEWLSMRDVQAAAVDIHAASGADVAEEKSTKAHALLWFLAGVVCTIGLMVIAAYLMVPDAF